MKIERIKSFILFSLVIISFVLTTRIWLYFSIEGLFDMHSKEAYSYQQIEQNEMMNLFKPDKLVVHIEENHTLLFNDEKNKAYYSSILNESNEILKDLLENGESYKKDSLKMDKLEDIRENFTVELIFNSYFELDYIKGLLNVQKNLWSDVKQVRSIIISPYNKKVYIVESGKSVIHEFTAANMSDKMEHIIAEISAKEDFAVFLNDFNEKNIQFYGKYAIAPVSIVSMPILTVEKEIKADINPSSEIIQLFNGENNKINSIEQDGIITFTDREEKTVRINTDGVFEYYKYNIISKEIKDTSMKEAIDIAASYVKAHFGFNGEFYLSNIESISQGGRTSFIIRFDYKYNGIPIVTDAASSNSAIEVEMIGNEVKRYKRNVSSVIQVEKIVNIKTFDEVLDIVQGRLDSYLNITKSESINRVNDLYLAFYESKKENILIPVWVADIDVEGFPGDIKNKKYIIRAEDGFIVGER